MRAWAMVGVLAMASAAAGEPGAPGYLLELGTDARAGAMGDAAGVSFLRSAPVPCEWVEFSAGFVGLVADARYDALGLVLPVDPQWTAAFAAAQVDSGEVTVRDAGGGEIGATADRSIFVRGAAAWRANTRLILDIGISGMYRDFGGTVATWTGTDVGSRYTVFHPVTVGLWLRGLRLSGFTRASGATYAVPVRLGGGVTAPLAGDTLVFAAELEKELAAPVAEGWRSAGGVEWRAARWLAFRAGYDGREPSAGVGIASERVRLDYAVSLADYAPLHRISCAARFNPPVWAFDSRRDVQDAARLAHCRVQTSVMSEIPCAVYHLLESRGVAVVRVEIINGADADVECEVVAQHALGAEGDRRRLVAAAGSSAVALLYPPLTISEIRSVTAVPTPSNIEVRVHARFPGGRPRRLYAGLPRTMLLPHDQFAPFVRDAAGRVHDLTDTLATWVAFNDPGLDQVIADAAERGSRSNPPVRLVGFQTAGAFSREPAEPRTLDERDRDALAQVRLLYETLRERHRMIYVNRPVLYGTTQRIKLPALTLRARGNCVELSVLMAALLESVELRPVLVVFPREGHAVVGWRVQGTDGSARVRMLETNLFGEPFDHVLERGEARLDEYQIRESLADRDVYGDDGLYRRDPDVIAYDLELVRPHVPPSPYVGGSESPDILPPMLPFPTR